MENRVDLKSFLPYLPLVAESSSLAWPAPLAEELNAMSRGPSNSNVNSGEALTSRIVSMRKFLSLNSSDIAPYAFQGYALFFDEKISEEESARWFGETVPVLASLLLRLPSLLEMHYQNADHLLDGFTTGLRILGPQEAGIVFLSQELIAALLACAFFCLFPESDRGPRHLQGINFDGFFAYLYTRHRKQQQENKIRCIVHYFERICSSIPTNVVSFERKVLPLEHRPPHVSYPEADYWCKSPIHLCPIEVHTSGFIEDQPGEALEVDFADEYLGGLALRNGCVQEEIRFMINPELIAGMLFLPRMCDNEAIEVVGVERFSNYTGYASSFRFAGDYVDKRDLDNFRRRKTKVLAIDAFPQPGRSQYKPERLLREVNKAFCGFLHHSKCQEDKSYKHYDEPSSIHEPLPSALVNQYAETSLERLALSSENEEKIGIATGNWGCGVFGGDPELKTMIQWVAASQAGRPFMSYYTFGLEALKNLDQVTQWIVSQEGTVGDLWNKLVEYSSQRLSRRTKLGLFSWLSPSLSAKASKIEQTL